MERICRLGLPGDSDMDLEAEARWLTWEIHRLMGERHLPVLPRNGSGNGAITVRSVLAISGSILGVVVASVMGFLVSELLQHTKEPWHPQAGMKFQLLDERTTEVRTNVRDIRIRVETIERKQAEQTILLKSIEKQVKK